MIKTRIEIVNESSDTVLTDEQVERVLPALQTQIRRDFAPVWGADADLIFVPKGEQPSKNTWWIGIFDNSHQATVLGYHHYTNSGLPLGKVFAGASIKLGSSWTCTLSHELLEMLADPDTNLVALVETPDKKKYLFAYEVCDACQDDSHGYKIDGVLVSDFVYPAWFELFHGKGTTQFDYSRQILEPLFILPGGYIPKMLLGGGNRWRQVNARSLPGRTVSRAKLYSRMERRRTPRDKRTQSEVKRA